jgi:hypothetical protein
MLEKPASEVSISADAVLASVAEFTEAAARIQAAIAKIDDRAQAAQADISAQVLRAIAIVDAKIASIPKYPERDPFNDPERLGY